MKTYLIVTIIAVGLYEWHTNHDTALWTYRRLEGK